MTRNLGRDRILTACAFVVVLLLSLFSGSLPGIAQAETGQTCSVPVTACGCAACGCPAVEPEPSCPPGEEIYGDLCLPSCPSGTVRYPGYPGVCLPSCDHGCPEGYEQVPLPDCPDGYHRDLGDPGYCAPDQYEPGGDTYCTQGTVYSAAEQKCVVDCPQGSYADAEGLCRSYYETDCPQGLHHDPETGRCVPQGEWPRGYAWICLPQCPEGYVRDIARPTHCLPPPTTCGEGYERAPNNRCEPVCEDGSQRDPYGYCAPKQCPEGQYAALNGTCGETECTGGYESYRGACLPPCEQGYSRSETGSCIPPDEDCPVGTQKFEGECLPECPEGYMQDTRTGKCSPPSQGCAPGEERFRGECVLPCEKGSIRNDQGRCVPTGCARGEEKVNGVCLPRCEPPLVRDTKNRCVCPQGTEAVAGRCLPLCREGLTRNAAGLCSCLPGMEFIGGRCEPACKKGLIRNAYGKCVPPSCPEGEENVRGRCLPECVNGQVRNGKGKCACPPGTETGASGYCQAVPTDCPKGYRRNGNGECVQKDKNRVHCPEGYSYSKRYKTCMPDKPANQSQPSTTPDKSTTSDLPLFKRTGKPLPAAGDCPKGYIRDTTGACIKG